VRRRRTARELEAEAATRPAPPDAALPPAGEAVAMLARRGLRTRPTRPDLPFPADLPEERAARLAAHLGHYAFRLFLRGAILRRGSFRPGEATRYLSAAKARPLAEALVDLGIAERRAGGRYRLLWPARSFGGTLEWWVARELRRRLALDVAVGLRSGAPGVGGDLDVVAAAEGRLFYLELKSSPPKHIQRAEVAAFLRRVRAIRPDVAIFAVDTALRLSDKVLPLLLSGISGAGAAHARPRRIVRETWALTPHVFAANAKQDLVENLCRAVAEGLRALAPPPP